MMTPQAGMNHAPPRGRDGTASAHTTAMLTWWADAGITRANLAVRRSDGMIWHHDCPLEDLPLASWPLVFVDDVVPGVARRSTQRTSALAVQTSDAGGCHLWVRCTAWLDERQRLGVQRWLARRLSGDRASVSGEHLGRLAGFKNWKRSGCWVNVLDATGGRAWAPHQVEAVAEPKQRAERIGPRVGLDLWAPRSPTRPPGRLPAPAPRSDTAWTS